MRITVFGATGTLGRHVVAEALAAGHEITAFARRADALKIEHDRLRKVAGDVLDPAAVAAATRGQDGVIVTLGAGMKGGVRATGTQRVIEAMKSEAVNRLIVLSTLGAGDSRRHLNFFWKYLMFGLLLRRAMADHEAQERVVRASGLDWTIVRPAAFTDDPAGSSYRHGTLAGESELKLELPRADVARFMLDQVASERYLHAAPALSC